MGYLFLTVSLLAGAIKGFCGKKTSGFVKGYNGAFLMNSIRMLLCILFGFCLILLEGNASFMIPTSKLLLVSALSGLTSAAFVVFWLISVRSGAYMMLDVFNMLGIFVPMILSRIFFSEEIRTNQWLGSIVLVIACIIMCSYNNSIKKKLNFSSLILLILCCLSNGLTDFSYTLFDKALPNVPKSVFSLYSYIFASTVLLLCFFFSRKSTSSQEKKDIVKKTSGYIIVMAVCLFLNTYFKSIAVPHLPTAVIYPLNQGAALILSTVMASLFFGEKLTAKCISGLITAFAGLLIINVI